MTLILTLSHLYLVLGLIAICLIGVCLLHLDRRLKSQERLINHLFGMAICESKEHKKEVK